jgi:MGT family glycosyltransferase
MSITTGETQSVSRPLRVAQVVRDGGAPRRQAASGVRRSCPPCTSPVLLGAADDLPVERVAALADINRARGVLGLPPVSSLTEQILDVDRLLVLTSRAFELPDVQPPDHVRYVGPQLLRSHQGPRVRLPEGDDPLILVALSTTDQGQLGLLERLLTAIASLPIRALVTLRPAVDADRLHPPPNAVLERFIVPHSAVLPHASLVITHAGHGSMMAATAAGVPLVCVPMGRDQPAVAARVIHHGLGVRVHPETGVEELRAAICHVLDQPSYHRAVQRMANAIEPADRVIDEIEALAATSDGRAA